MTAIVLVLPIVARPNFDSAAWCEQIDRELAAHPLQRQAPPPRTRPLLVTSERISTRAYNTLLRGVAGALNDND